MKHIFQSFVSSRDDIDRLITILALLVALK